MSIEPDSRVSPSTDMAAATPPQAKLLVFFFPDEAKVDQAVGALMTRLTPKDDMNLYRLAVVARNSDGKVCIKDLTEKELGTVGAGALIGGLAGLAGGPVGAAIGAGAGALFGWSAELVNEEAVTEFANKHLQGLAPGRRAIMAEIDEEASPRFVALMQANGGTTASK
jgi:uncharacterized membrane protein